MKMFNSDRKALGMSEITHCPDCRRKTHAWVVEFVADDWMTNLDANETRRLRCHPCGWARPKKYVGPPVWWNPLSWINGGRYR